MPYAPERLTPADPDDVAWTLSYARRYDGRRPFKPSGELMAKITAEHLAECLRRSGFVVMKRPAPPPGPSAPWGPPKKSRLTD